MIIMNKFIVLLLTSLFVITGCEDHDYCDDEIGAYIIGTRFVKEKLKSPSQADFPKFMDVSSRTFRTGACKYHTEAYVDAPNSFGVKIRTHYSAEVEYNKESRKWSLNRLEI